MAKTDIIQELNELGSSLAAGSGQNIYSVPGGYFEGLADDVLSGIKSEAFLSGLPKQNPYELPAGYFEGLSEKILNEVRKHPDYLNSKEELESISPFLSSLNKKPVFSVPENYFESLVAKPKQQEAKVIFITRKSWFKYAAAAMVAGVILAAGLFIFTREKVSVNNPHAWVAKNLKKVSTDDINAFVKLAEPGVTVDANNNTPAKQSEIKDLMKDVPETEIEQFVNETAAAYDESTEDVMMN